jgi:hypothetical protein
MRLRLALPILLASASVMLSGIGLAVAQDGDRTPQVRRTDGATEDPARPAGKIRPFRFGDEDRSGGRVGPGARVDFTLEDADLPDLVRMIARITGKRFILPGKARSIKATVASTRPVTAAEAYRAFLSILEINGMTVVQAGRYLKIIDSSGVDGQPIRVYRDGEATPSDDRFITRMHSGREHLGRGRRRTLPGPLQVAPRATITAYAPTNTLILTDTGTNVIRRMLRILQEIRRSPGPASRSGSSRCTTPNAERSRRSACTEIFPVGERSSGAGRRILGAADRRRSATKAAARPTARARRGGDAAATAARRRPSGPAPASRASPTSSPTTAPTASSSSPPSAPTSASSRSSGALDVPVEGEGRDPRPPPPERRRRGDRVARSRA